MKKNKHIFLLGALFFLFALVKYAFTPDEMPTTFIVFEVLSFLVVLYIIYFILNFIETCMHGADNSKMDKECIRRQSEITCLRSRLEEVEHANINETDEDKYGNSDLFIESINKHLGEVNEQSVVEIANLITSRYEVMALVGYCSNNDEQCVPVKTYGVGEDIQMPAINTTEGLHAQALADNKAMEIEDIPHDYIEVGSGSGSTKPLILYILPVIDGSKVMIFEIASFKKLDLVDVWNKLDGQQ
ncbi:hypothetical protein [Carboxylicivirga marina]|uniref:hypothetical protein n=1 Tax=Carboxylicivirga marina TaxID=2800988 RepID=UPI00259923B7|nr:hypothetical protein [uncultured Carboxylicivirga sp.]